MQEERNEKLIAIHPQGAKKARGPFLRAEECTVLTSAGR